MYNDKKTFERLSEMVKSMGVERTAKKIKCSHSHVIYMNKNKSCSPTMEKNINNSYNKWRK